MKIRRNLTTGLAMVLLVATQWLGGCAIQPTRSVARPEQARFLWLAGLSGHCWNENTFHSEVCYWFSRNNSELLGCGKSKFAADTGSTVDTFSWDRRITETIRSQQLTAAALTISQPSPFAAERKKPLQLAGMSRIDNTHFAIRDRNQGPTLVFRRGHVLSAGDGDLSRCLNWESALRVPTQP